MTDDKDEPEADLPALIINYIMEKLPDSKKKALAGFIEDQVFPLYEMATGDVVGSHKDARDMLADKLEHDLASVVWVLQDNLEEDTEFVDEDEESIEEDAEVKEREFMIRRVFAQSAKDGLYELVVVVAPVEDRTVTQDMSLSVFLTVFKPKDGTVLRYFDS